MNILTTIVSVFLQICQGCMLTWLIIHLFWEVQFVGRLARLIGSKDWIFYPFHLLAAIGLLYEVLVNLDFIWFNPMQLIAVAGHSSGCLATFIFTIYKNIIILKISSVNTRVLIYFFYFITQKIETTNSLYF